MRLLRRTLFSFMAAFLAPGASCAAEGLAKAEYDCNFGHPDPQDRSGESVVYRCRPAAGAEAPVFNVAVLKGAPSEVSRAHGYLLARETELGPLSETIDLVKFGLSQHSFVLRPAMENVIACFNDNLFNSLTPDFRASVAAFEQGYRQRLGAAAKYKTPQLRLASTSIELDNIMTAVAYQHSKLGSVLVVEENCPGSLFVKVILNGLKVAGRDKGLGCTAFAIPAKDESGTVLSAEGLLVGRTLDAELMRSWNKVPTLFVIHEEGRDDRGRPYLSYVATGAAGLLYPGGISGYNTEGIAVTLHEMYPSDAVLRVPDDQPRKAALAPVIQQTILREARTIDDALAIASRYQAIATWTILIAEAKTGKAAAIEISKGGAKLVRQTQNRPIAQTNHVVDTEQQAYAFFPSYNKYNETHTRMATLERAFDRLQMAAGEAHPFDAAQAVAQLANHDDIDGRFQPFGTTAVKAYDVMSTVMLPEAHKIYMSVGDFAPSPHATFLGFQLDGNLDPVGTLGTLRDQTLAGTPGVLFSLSDYVQARLAYEVRDYAGAERLLRQAVAHAQDEATDGADPVWAGRKAGALRVYSYILARLLASKATQDFPGQTRSRDARTAAYAESRQLFDALIEDPDVLPYQRALAEYHLGLTELKFRRGFLSRGLSEQTRERVDEALRVFQSKRDALKPTIEIKDIDTDIENARKVLAGDKSIKEDDIDWVVMR
jgi:hypothetical protein